jgi:hypothetical protein
MPQLPDPLPAIEVASNGQWIALDTNGWKEVAEEERISMLLPLVELISSAASGSGGIGLTCHTNNEVVKAAMFIQSLTNDARGGRGGTTKTLDSGIVVPDDDAESVTKNSANTNFALILPCDMALLRTTKLLFGDKC